MKNKTSNHEKAPICAEFVKQMREVFGDDQVKVIWVKEGDFEMGKPDGSVIHS
jgi:predicted Mrr-cat superfamily restriction endonuclease